ncbi:multidrug effflux MFS transporter [Thauera sinica]|uniref:Bcr/CflA family efflux transporter n=1 Tax=Thauera sinica TaxID=2665146 RepID=A0ABW1AVC0_9RHOO|nr:multidrug effflux MFS transporter [Thauera sp. K11]ATE61162.1 Bcr/CflA family drug resistance efflux transporter [Thauera sp. K11]
MSPPFVILILSLLLGLQPLTTDLYLPALPALTKSFGTVPAQAQLTLTALLLAFGLSQLVWGPVSDLVGRRKVLLAGLAGYTVAAVGSTLAASIEALVLWRTVQGACMGAGTVCARAIVRDLYAPEAGARAMSKGLSGLGVVACISPPLGGLVAELFGWRTALMLLALFGGATLFVVARRFEETLRERRPAALRPAVLAGTARQILGNGTFWAFALLCTSSFGGLFCFLASSSFIFIGLFGFSSTAYGMVLLSLSACYIAGTMLCRRLLVRIGVTRAVRVGGLLSLSGGGLMAALLVAGVNDPWAVMAPAWLYMLGHGIHQPCGQSGAVGPFPQAAGTASALAGFLMMAVAFASGGWVGAHMDGTASPLIEGMAFWSVSVALVAWVLVRRVGPRHEPAAPSAAGAASRQGCA